MTEQTKTLEEWERQKGLVVRNLGSRKPGHQLTEEDFMTINDFVGVNYEDRIAFLKANGYEVNRANLIDSGLSTRQEEEAAK